MDEVGNTRIRVDRHPIHRHWSSLCWFLAGARSVPTGRAMRDEAMLGALDRIWKASRNAALERVAALESATSALADGPLPDVTRREVEREAHKLASAVSSFGFWTAASLAREAE